MAGGFLPPEAPGPEPDLGPRPKPAAPNELPTSPPALGGQQQGWQQAPPGYWQPQGRPPGGPQEPDNGPAVAGFVLAVVAAVLLLFSVLLLAFVSVILAAFGLVYSRRGKRKVESGETLRHRGLAQAGYVTSIVTLVIAIPVTLLEIVFLIAYATDEQFREDFNDEFDDEFDTSPLEGTESLGLLVRVAVPVVRGVAGLVA